MQLYLDCDGVLADFDKAATELLKMPPRQFEKRHGPPEFWRRLARHPDFYGSLPLMPDAMILFEAVRHLDPIVLTGLPRGDWAAPQKVRWAAQHFPGTASASGGAAWHSSIARWPACVGKSGDPQFRVIHTGR